MVQIYRFSEYFCAGRELTVDLLQEVPQSNDLKTWSVCDWEGYFSRIAIPTVLNDLSPDGIMANLKSNWACLEGIWKILATGVSADGIGLAIFPFFREVPYTVKEGDNFQVSTTLQLANWIMKG